ncbi:thump domain-containing protein [Thelephora terrestris]|uniref:Thump domain-containing protein n=1 Tax=Thelephora terrestris TaxID=56493 RepID=A0A9P6HME8_9AGAM|nr:thump domain-containing protein [Thelephora terrestris]
MSDSTPGDATKRKNTGHDREKGRRFRSDGTSIWTKPGVSGPGVWVSCIKGKEKQAVGEVYQVFESIASDVWPQSAPDGDGEKSVESDGAEDGDDFEAQIAKELAAIKRPRKEQRFANCQTGTPCLIFISCKPPVDPVKLVLKYLEGVRETGITQTRYILRLTPVSNSCVTALPEIKHLIQKAMEEFVSPLGDDVAFSFKIELKIRNHSTLTRQSLIEAVGESVPRKFKVDLEAPEVFILVEVFKSTCGVSVVRDYYNLKKFNVLELASEGRREDTKIGLAP